LHRGRRLKSSIREILIALLLAGIVIVLSAGICFAGAWTQSKGGLYDRLSINYYYADDEFDSRGKTDFPLNGNFKDFHVGNYIEYGLTDRITLINSIYYKTIRKEDDEVKQHTWGFGDVDVAAKYKIAEGQWGVLSGQGLVKIPGPYDGDISLPLGNKQWDIEARLLYGRSLYPHIPGYVNFELAYRVRFGDPSDELRYLVEFGMDFTKQFYGRVKLDGIYSMNNGADFDNSGNPTITNNFNVGKVFITAGYKIAGNWGLEVEYTPELYGKNTAAGATYSLALVYQIQ
jgi:hypothetical protein